jgi:hypothetical protein
MEPADELIERSASASEELSSTADSCRHRRF